MGNIFSSGLNETIKCINHFLAATCPRQQRQRAQGCGGTGGGERRALGWACTGLWPWAPFPVLGELSTPQSSPPAALGQKHTPAHPHGSKLSTFWLQWDGLTESHDRSFSVSFLWAEHHFCAWNTQFSFLWVPKVSFWPTGISYFWFWGKFQSALFDFLLQESWNSLSWEGP